MNINTNYTKTSLSSNAVSQNKSPAFRAMPIMHINLRHIASDKTETLIPAVFSRLDPNDVDDIMLMSKLHATWDKSCKLYAKISKSFFKRDQDFGFYMIETKKEEDAAKRVKSLMILDNIDKRRWSNKLTLWYLQAAPEIADNKNSAIRGCGENMIYCAARIMNTLRDRYNTLEILSENDSFYRHLELKKVRFFIKAQSAFQLTEKMAPDFFKKNEAKYQHPTKFDSLMEQSSELSRINNFRNGLNYFI